VNHGKIRPFNAGDLLWDGVKNFRMMKRSISSLAAGSTRAGETNMAEIAKNSTLQKHQGLCLSRLILAGRQEVSG
jgi:hypothetical protein